MFPVENLKGYQTIENDRHALQNQMNQYYQRKNQWNISKTTAHNILLIGRSRAGKSTVRKTLIDPLSISAQLNLYAETKDVDMASLQVDRMSDRLSSAEQHPNNANDRFILNIIDTPGLFELKKGVELARDNNQLLMTIRNGLKRIGTSYHYICFCISVIDGIRKEDIETLDTALLYFGLATFVEHICIIITRCEMKDDAQRGKLKAELEKELPFVKQLKRGVLFAGCLSHEQYAVVDKTSLAVQLRNVISYRETLLNLFSTPIDPCELKGNETMMPYTTKPVPQPAYDPYSGVGYTPPKKSHSATGSMATAYASAFKATPAPTEPSCACDREVHCKTHCPYRHRDNCLLQ